jgi:hypothetical protein
MAPQFSPQLEGMTHASLRGTCETHGVQFDADWCFLKRPALPARVS